MGHFASPRGFASSQQRPRVPGAQAATRRFTTQVSPLSALITHNSLTASPPLFLIDTDTASTLWPCRTCPTTYCERCLPEEISFAGDEIVCEECQEVLLLLAHSLACALLVVAVAWRGLNMRPRAQVLTTSGGIIMIPT